MAGNISLTNILIVGLVGTFIIATLFGSYLSFCTINGCSIQEPYNSAFKNISEKYGGFGGVASSASNQSTVTNIYNAGKNIITGTVNVFIVGLDAIGKFFNMIPLIGDILSTITNVIPGFSGLVGLLTIIITLYIGMRYIQTASNKQDVP